MKTPTLDPENPIDFELFNQMRELMDSEFEPLLKAFYTDAQSYITTAVDTLETHPKAAEEAVHKLKGASLSLGAAELSRISFLALQLIRSGELAKAKPELRQLEAALATFKQASQQALQS